MTFRLWRKVYNIKAEKHSVIPAVTHFNGSGRLQTVEEKDNPRYYNLIKRFSEKSGIPILLNTSFNENEPIVNDPGHAYDCFARTDMDVLVLENYVITRGLAIGDWRLAIGDWRLAIGDWRKKRI